MSGKEKGPVSEANRHQGRGKDQPTSLIVPRDESESLRPVVVEGLRAAKVAEVALEVILRSLDKRAELAARRVREESEEKRR